MDKHQQEQKRFLEEQLEWSRHQTYILDLINEKLHAMKKIAIYAQENNLSQEEADTLNGQLNELKAEIQALEKQYHSIVEH